MESSERKPSRRFERIAGYYRYLAIMVLNTLLFLLGVNLLLLTIGQPVDDSAKVLGRRVLDRYSEEIVATAYPNRSLEEVRAIHMETWSHPLVPEAFTGFKERPRKSKYANVFDDGYRAVREQGPWPPSPENFNVFIFGGSTVFGYGLADEDTIPSRLQEALRVKGRRTSICVYNLGRGFYFLAQERVLFGRLLADDIKPDIAVFIDGLNECLTFDGNPVQPGHLVPGASSAGWFERLPLVQLVKKMSEPNAAERSALIARMGPDTSDPMSEIVARYLRNVSLVHGLCAASDVQPLFVWQPIPTFRTPPEACPFPSPEGFSIESDVYENFDQWLDFRDPPENFFWAVNLAQGQDAILYVDDVHYSAIFCDVIAKAIAEQPVFDVLGTRQP